MNKKRTGIFFTVICICLAFSLLLSSCAPVKITKLRMQSEKPQAAANAGAKYHSAKRDTFKLICKSGLIELYFDEQTSAVGILDTSADVFWSSLPENNEKSLALAPLKILLTGKNGESYELNSQDNSVNFGNMSFEKTKDGVNVKYALSLDSAAGKADFDTLPDGTVRADITVSYSLSDGSFYTSVSMNNVRLPRGIFLEKLELLDAFGAYTDENKDDFMFIPDGSGAVIKTGISEPDFTPVSLKVYDGALLGAYGIKHGKGAYLCIIEKGESIAEITAHRKSEYGFNTVSAEFAVTDCVQKSGKSVGSKSLGFVYGGEMRLCYRFLSGKSATYSGMAAACRENLIRNSVISSKTVDTGVSALPLIVSLQFGYCDPSGKLTVKSTYEQAEALMALLKAKGVNNVYLRACGLFKNANNAESKDFGKLSNALGNKNAYNSLYSYMKTQNFALYADTPLLSVRSGGAKSLTGKHLYLTNSGDALNLPTEKRRYLKMADLEDKTEALLYASGSFSFDGFSLNDIGTSLYADYSSDFYPRESSKKEIASLIPVLSSTGPVMIEKGNFYSVKNATVIFSLPQGTAVKEETPAYRAVPFTSLLLHGTYEYSISDINLSENPTETFLKSIELGALPSAFWYCAKTDKDDKYGYDNNINDIVTYCVKANDILSDLRDARMTSHQEIQSGVYCTEYNNSTKVYVNYTEKDVNINGITVSARDCVKIS